MLIYVHFLRCSKQYRHVIIFSVSRCILLCYSKSVPKASLFIFFLLFYVALVIIFLFGNDSYLRFLLLRNSWFYVWTMNHDWFLFRHRLIIIDGLDAVLLKLSLSRNVDCEASSNDYYWDKYTSRNCTHQNLSCLTNTRWARCVTQSLITVHWRSSFDANRIDSHWTHTYYAVTRSSTPESKQGPISTESFRGACQ